MEILNTTPIYNTLLIDIFYLISFFCMIFIIIFGMLILAYKATGESCDDKIHIAFVTSLLLTITFWLFAIIIDFYNTEVIAYQHKVIFTEEEMNINDFLEKYEVIGNEGKIWTIEEKVKEDK